VQPIARQRRRYNKVVPTTVKPARKPRWYFIPIRVLLVTFLLTLLSFALGLLIGILSMVIRGLLRGAHPNMTVAYRHVALPAAVILGAIALIVSSVFEIRRYRHTKALAEIAHASR